MKNNIILLLVNHYSFILQESMSLFGPMILNIFEAVTPYNDTKIFDNMFFMIITLNT